MNTPVYQPQPFQDDEIDLFELAERLWARKLLIIIITALAAVISVAVALLLPPTWQSEARIYPTSDAGLTHLNSLKQQIEGGGYNPATPPQVFNTYYRYLTAPSTLREVFHNSGLAEKALQANPGGDQKKVLASAFQKFSESLSSNQSDPKKDAGEFLTIRFTSQDQAFTAELINDQLLPLVRSKILNLYSESLEAERIDTTNSLNRSIQQAETQYIESSRFKSLQLEEALSVARAGGIIKPEQNQNLGSSSHDAWFLMGTDILSESLKLQKSELDRYRFISRPQSDDADKPFLANVAPLFLRIESLKTLNTKLEDLQPVAIDEPATIPVSPIKPKKKLIIALGVVLGGMLGVFIALIQITVTSRKEKQALAEQVPSVPHPSADATFSR
ncbi:LPS O-antigen chain length determinant protein WzzB [Sansalvadorimonas verongulae]|uniref:LPS O-antigen chain length determinant protein WzzB n=1 Tax=Sansalvadorimonas verongulae TaxID=2172824 RepID=UPI0012BCCF01|nr:Wzz/FepE/Etk N-terminal domain-containing protein [Sansalvadorimonas verongulae]MTI15487.1 hypothetical protein [Sansalvadorimonas verongulae]